MHTKYSILQKKKDGMEVMALEPLLCPDHRKVFSGGICKNCCGVIWKCLILSKDTTLFLATQKRCIESEGLYILIKEGSEHE